MIEGKRIAVVMPAYNAAKTIEATVHELPSIVDIKYWSTTPAQMIRFASHANLA